MTEFSVSFTITIQGTTEVEADDEEEALSTVEDWDISDFGDFSSGDDEVDITFDISEIVLSEEDKARRQAMIAEVLEKERIRREEQGTSSL